MVRPIGQGLLRGLVLAVLAPMAPALAASAPAASALTATSLPADTYVLGDSLGEGVQEVTHLKGFAHISVHIRGPRALEQLAQTPPNATVFLVLGTNDADGTIARLDKSIDDIVGAAARKNITLIWLGPPCVRQSWDSRARDLDLMLSARFAGTPVRYVSMRDAELCSGSLQEPDGVHLKPKGYVHMWEKATAAAGFAGAAEPTALLRVRCASRSCRCRSPVARWQRTATAAPTMRSRPSSRRGAPLRPAFRCRSRAGRRQAM